MELCRREIAPSKRNHAGNPDLHGLLLAYYDWHSELQILQAEKNGKNAETLNRIGRLEQEILPPDTGPPEVLTQCKAAAIAVAICS
jgi:hypothetical protein